MSRPPQSSPPSASPASRPNSPKWFRWSLFALLLGLYWAILFVATHWPTMRDAGIPYLDKVLHAAAFLGLAVLLGLVIGLHRLRWSGFLLVFVVVSSYGLVDELLQIPIEGRQADVWDWVADCTGAVLGVACLLLARRWFVRPLAAVAESRF